MRGASGSLAALNDSGRAPALVSTAQVSLHVGFRDVNKRKLIQINWREMRRP
jgi:hypothetical protein